MAHCVQLRFILRNRLDSQTLVLLHRSTNRANTLSRPTLLTYSPRTNPRSSSDDLHTLNTLKMSDIAMDTPTDSQTGGTTVRGNKPDLYHGERSKLETWLLQVDRYFHLQGDKIEDNDKVVLASTYFRGDAEKWANPILRRYMDDSITDTENVDLVENWDAFKTKMREIFSPFKESVIAEQKIQILKQTQSAADYTTKFQQYQTVINWDDTALMRMYKQGLKPAVRMELMRSGSSVNTLEELMAEAIRLDNELYELKLEERLYQQGTRDHGNTNARPKGQQSRRSYPNQGRQRSYTPRLPGVYTRGYEPMHLDILNKGNGPSKEYKKKPHDRNKKITCYGCGKEGHMARDCRNKNKVTRQLNVLQSAAPNDGEEEWNVITIPTFEIRDQTNEIINGIEDITIITKEEPSSDEYISEDEDLEATEIDKTKFGKMAKYEESHRPSTPYAPEEQMKTLSSQINQLLRYLNKPPIEYAYETPDIMAAMRQDFYRLSQEVEQDKENVPLKIREFLPTSDELDWIDRAITLQEDEQIIQVPTNLEKDINALLKQLGKPQQDFSNTKHHFHAEFSKYNQYLDLCKEFRDKGMDPEETLKWAKAAETSWKELSEEEIATNQAEADKWADQYARQQEIRRQQNRQARNVTNQDIHYWMDPRNPEHGKLSWIGCLHDHCTIHYSDKYGASYFPRKFRGMPRCTYQWFDCPKDECATHLWDKRHKPYFYGHEDPQETLQMHMTQQKDYEDGTSAWECNQPSWHTCLNIECDLHIVAKKFYGYGNQSFLDGRPIHLEPLRRSTH